MTDNRFHVIYAPGGARKGILFGPAMARAVADLIATGCGIGCWRG